MNANQQHEHRVDLQSAVMELIRQYEETTGLKVESLHYGPGVSEMTTRSGVTIVTRPDDAG
jgi:hypothetical protein